MTDDTPAPPLVLDPVTGDVMHVEAWLSSASTLVKLQDIEDTMGPAARRIAECTSRAVANFAAVIGRPPRPAETMKIVGAVTRYVIGQADGQLN